jgi:hypothetical protein
MIEVTRYPLWGYCRIEGILANLGYAIGHKTGSYTMIDVVRIPQRVVVITALGFALWGVSLSAEAGQTVDEIDAHQGNVRILLYRSYLPRFGRAQVPLPDITVVKNGVTTKLPLCPNRQDTFDADFTPARELFAHGEDNLPLIIEAIADIAKIRRQGDFPHCAWWLVADSDNFNIAFPDANASYWVQPFITSDDTEVYIDGVYPDERYMSLALYNQNLDFYFYRPTPNRPNATVPSFITDFEIAPNAGSLNPWQQIASGGGSYRVTIKPHPEFGEVNVLPWFDNVQPEAERAQGSFPIPPPCGRADSISACTVNTQFVSPPTAVQSSIFSNPDNGYLPARVTLDAVDRVYVIRGKAPRAPAGESPVPWDPSSDAYEVRYWSFCSAIYLRPYPTIEGETGLNQRSAACVADRDIPLDEHGMYTIVFSTEAAKPLNLEDNVVWIKGVRGPANILIYRHMLPTNHFENSVQEVPRSGSFVDAMTTMGPYYPLITVSCTKAHYEANGWGGCVAPKVLTNPDGLGSGPGLPGVGGP